MSRVMTPGEAGRGCMWSVCMRVASIDQCEEAAAASGVRGGFHICHALVLYSPPEGSLSSCVDQVMLLLVMATFLDHPQFWGLDRNSIQTPSFFFFFLILGAS